MHDGGNDGARRGLHFDATITAGNVGSMVAVLAIGLPILLSLNSQVSANTSDIASLRRELAQQHNDIQIALTGINNELVMIDAKLDSKADKTGWAGPK